MTGRDSVLSTILLLLGVRALAAPDFPAYSVTDLKALGVWPVAINESGQVVGRLLRAAVDRPRVVRSR